MDFFAQQEKVRRSSRWLVVLFILAVLAVVVSVDVVLALGFGLARQHQVPGAPMFQGINWHVLLGVSLAVIAGMGLASLFRSLSLRSGGGVVAQGLGATAVSPDTDNPVWRQLRNVIEEVAIASGVPVPDIYVLEREEGINAFAAGYGPSDAAVCVTQGCLDRLTRDELQGVIAHEFSHILNGDMRLNIRLMGLLFGVLAIGVVGRFMMYSGAGMRSRRNNNNTTSIAMIGIALLIVGYVGFFFGRLIQAAVARSRESLADASAVQFTRQADGIAGALKKIAALAEGSALRAHNAQEVAHMLFGEVGSLSRLFATHPPLPERIRALGVRFDPDELDAIARDWAEPTMAHAGDDARASMSGFAPAGVFTPGATARGAMPDAGASLRLDAHAVAAQTGQPGRGDVEAAGALRRGIPDALRTQTHEPQRATALMLALTLEADTGLRDAQLLRIDSAMGSAMAESVEAMQADIQALHPMLRLPLAALAFPALKRRPQPQLDRLLDTMDALVRIDQHVSLHEFCLMMWLRTQLVHALDPAHGFVPGSRRLSQCRESYAVLCAVLADHGHASADDARRAFDQAINEALPDAHMDYAPPRDWQPALIDALERLNRLAPRSKELLIRGLVRAVAADGAVTVAEAEMLRLVCAMLQCPLPALIRDIAPDAA